MKVSNASLSRFFPNRLFRIWATQVSRHGLLLVFSVVLFYSWGQAQPAPSALVVGGQGGIPWSEPVLRWIALDDTTRVGALQLQEIPRDQNILRERVRVISGLLPRNIFKYRWSFNRGDYGMDIDTLLVHWHPRLWEGGAAEARGFRGLVDGDELTCAFGGLNRDIWLTVDLGVPIAVDSVAFFPPMRGFTADGTPFSDLHPKAYEVSRTNRIVDWLIFEDEAASTGRPGYGPLDEVIGRSFLNTESVVGLSAPLRFTRFLRFRFERGEGRQMVSELKAYGRGFPAEGRYISIPYEFDDPVSFGNIHWRFTKYRLGPTGEIYEDPTAPVSLSIRTRAGIDSDPQAYFIYDELGRRTEVDRDTYFRAEPPKGAFEDGLPDFRAAVTDDVGNWNTWSIVYQNSGDKIRSSDGRRYFQFRIEIATEDPFAFGVLDSVVFEISPLLADSVLAEISLDGQPTPDGRIVEVPLGVDTVFVYDLRTVFNRMDRNGFDSIALEVPEGTQLVDMEIDGVPARMDHDFSLLPTEPGYIRLAFPERYTEDVAFRIRLRGAVFRPTVFFGGYIFDRNPDVAFLPQSIEPGNARDDVNTNDIRVVAAQAKITVLGDVELSSPMITPTGEGINEQTDIEFFVFGVENALIHAKIHDLTGQLVAVLKSEHGSAGRYAVAWNGRDSRGTLVPPGLYVLKVEIAVDTGSYTALRSIAVAY